MKGIVIPDRDTDFTADTSELFFDLVFVFAFSRLVDHLVHTPTWTGFGEFVLLMLMVWLPWTQMTWSANAVSSHSRPVRVLVLVAAVASVPMAGAVTAAFDDGGAPFAVSLGVILAMGLFTMFAGLPPGSAHRRSIVEYSIPNCVAIALLVVGGWLPREARIGCWVAAMAVVLAGTLRAGKQEWLVRPGHFAERHGLIVIIALGEVIVALGVPVVADLDADGGLSARTIVALIGAGSFACLMWWGYFDRPLPALEHRHGEHDDDRLRGRFARDVYTYGHLPITAGVILCAAALEEVTLHPDAPLATPFALMLIGGLALYLLGVSVAVMRAFGVIAIERVVGSAALSIVVVAIADLDAIYVLLIVDALLLLMLWIEHRRVEVKHRGDPAELAAG